jgi:peptidyl-prolyl cis-trans isomerase C
MREPLLQFLLVGAALFLLYHFVAPPRPAAQGSRIELSQDDLKQIEVAWESNWQRPPTPAEWRDLVEAQVREQVLYREALAMGLDQGDVIVRRRMGQKLDFLLDDAASLRDPNPAELEAWFRANASQFIVRGRATFCHVYFSPDVKGPQAAARITRALAALKGRTSCASSRIAGLGDRFPDQDYYAEWSPDQVANVFGTEFSKSLFKLPPGRWQGPVLSGLGMHLVLLETLEPDRIPRYDEVDHGKVEAAWVDARRAEAKRKAYETIRAKYKVVLPKQFAP